MTDSIPIETTVYRCSAEADVDSFLNDARIRAVNIILRAVP